MIWISIMVLILIMLFILANYFFNIAINAKKDKAFIFDAEHNKLPDSDFRQKLIEEGKLWYEKIDKKEVYIKSHDNLKLHGVIIENKMSNIWVTISHGYFGNINSVIPGAKLFYNLGYNLLLIDARACGKSEGSFIGLGYLDKFDLIKWLEFLNRTYKDIKIFLFGASMGASTVMMASGEKLPDNAKGIIEDCGYSSITKEFSYQAKVLYKLPSFPLIPILSLITKIRAGYWLENVKPLNAVERSKVPMLFIHGGKDTFVPSSMLYELYKRKNGVKSKLLIKAAGHGSSYWMGYKKYWSSIKRFIDINQK